MNIGAFITALLMRDRVRDRRATAAADYERTQRAIDAMAADLNAEIAADIPHAAAELMRIIPAAEDIIVDRWQAMIAQGQASLARGDLEAADEAWTSWVEAGFPPLHQLWLDAITLSTQYKLAPRLSEIQERVFDGLGKYLEGMYATMDGDLHRGRELCGDGADVWRSVQALSR